jgi:hypothetical protein
MSSRNFTVYAMVLANIADEILSKYAGWKKTPVGRRIMILLTGLDENKKIIK